MVVRRKCKGALLELRPKNISCSCIYLAPFCVNTLIKKPVRFFEGKKQSQLLPEYCRVTPFDKMTFCRVVKVLKRIYRPYVIVNFFLLFDNIDLYDVSIDRKHLGGFRF